MSELELGVPSHLAFNLARLIVNEEKEIDIKMGLSRFAPSSSFSVSTVRKPPPSIENAEVLRKYYLHPARSPTPEWNFYAAMVGFLEYSNYIGRACALLTSEEQYDGFFSSDLFRDLRLSMPHSLQMVLKDLVKYGCAELLFRLFESERKLVEEHQINKSAWLHLFPLFSSDVYYSLGSEYVYRYLDDYNKFKTFVKIAHPESTDEELEQEMHSRLSRLLFSFPIGPNLLAWYIAELQSKKLLSSNSVTLSPRKAEVVNPLETPDWRGEAVEMLVKHKELFRLSDETVLHMFQQTLGWAFAHTRLDFLEFCAKHMDLLTQEVMEGLSFSAESQQDDPLTFVRFLFDRFPRPLVTLFISKWFNCRIDNLESDGKLPYSIFMDLPKVLDFLLENGYKLDLSSFVEYSISIFSMEGLCHFFESKGYAIDYFIGKGADISLQVLEKSMNPDDFKGYFTAFIEDVLGSANALFLLKRFDAFFGTPLLSRFQELNVDLGWFVSWAPMKRLMNDKASMMESLNALEFILSKNKFAFTRAVFMDGIKDGLSRAPKYSKRKILEFLAKLH